MAISLAQGLRNAVYSMNDIQSQIDTANKRLATGRKVNSALDNAGAYFKSVGLQKESRDLGSLLDGLERGGKIIKKATDALEGMRKLFESAQALARQARQLASTDTARTTLRDQVAELMTQASRLAYDSGFDGSRLLQTDAVALPAVTLNTNTATTGGTTITLAGQDSRFDQAAGIANFTAAATGLTVTTTAGQPQSVAGTGVWAAAPGDALIDTTITNFQNALTTIQARASAIATQSSVIDIRKDFIKNSQRANAELADYLTLADMNEEGANLTALQTKQQLAVTSLSLAGRSEQAILRLF